MLERLDDPDLVANIKEEIGREINMRGGAERIRITALASPKNREAALGKSLAQIAAAWNLSPEETVVRLLKEEKGVVNAVYFSMDPEDVKTILSDENVKWLRWQRYGPGEGKDYPSRSSTFAR